MWINTPSFDNKDQITNKELKNKVKENLIISLNTKKSLWELKDDFETNKEILAYKDTIFEEFKSNIWNSETTKLINEKINDIFNNLRENSDRYKMIKVIEEVTNITKDWNDLDINKINNLLEEFDLISPELLMILWIFMLIVWVVMFPVEGFAASLLLWVWTYWTLKATLENSELEDIKLLDSINNIIPDINEKHFNLIKDSIDYSLKDKSELIIKLSTELEKAYEDKILTDEEVKEIIKEL